MYVLFMISRLGASPADVNTLRNSFVVNSTSDWKKHSIFFGKEKNKKSSDNLIKGSIF